MSAEMWDEWERQMKKANPASPLDHKARDLAIAYFGLRHRTITGASKTIGVDRQTVTRRLQRAHDNGWAILGDAPAKARTGTLPRVCRRRVFWTTDYWTVAAWNRDTSAPAF